MKLTVLTDNSSMSCNMQPEHGLSLVLSTPQMHILLDTGPSGRFIQHAAQLGIDLSTVDYVFLSHGHIDHTGGLRPFLEINSKARVIVAEEALNSHLFSHRNGRKDIGTNDEFNDSKHRIIHNLSAISHTNIHIFATTTTDFQAPKANATLTRVNATGEVPDNFSHERILTIEDESKLIVYTGCAHKGILNILAEVENRLGRPADIAIGGLHLPDGDFETEAEIMELATQLKTHFPNTRLLTGHCTGEKAFAILQRELGSQIQLFYTGLSINL